jgi:hypothetical protein
MANDAGQVRPAAGPEDIAHAARLLSSPAIKRIAEEQKDEPGSIRLLHRDGEPVGAIAHRREEWEIGSSKLKVARVWECSGEYDEQAFRNTGDRAVFDALVEDWLFGLRGEGYQLAYAHGELALWPEHDFVPSFFHARVLVPVARALHLKIRHRVRPFRSSDKRHVARLMQSNRDLRPRVFATGVPNFNHYVVEAVDKRVLGYFSMGLLDSPRQPKVFLPEVETEDRGAAESILAFAAPHARKAGISALSFPLAADHPFARVCIDLGGYHQIRGATRDVTLDEEMVRVIDVRAVFEALETDLALRLLDAGVSGEQRELTMVVGSERVPLRLDPQGIRPIDGTESKTEVRLPRWAFTQLVMGYRTGADLPPDTVSPEGATRLLDTLFPKTWPLSLCDHDIWDPSLKDPEKYSEKAKALLHLVRLPY